jgi:hypothetical protein
MPTRYGIIQKTEDRSERQLLNADTVIYRALAAVSRAGFVAGRSYGGKFNELATLMRQLSTLKIVVFYPSRSLADQLEAWSERHGGQQLLTSGERSLAEIRRRTRPMDFAVIDATEDPAQASDAFFQACRTLGSERVAVYTETAHDGLELLVRRLGVPLLLGPMELFEWDGLFLHKFPTIIPLRPTPSAYGGSSTEPTPGGEKYVA